MNELTNAANPSKLAQEYPAHTRDALKLKCGVCGAVGRYDVGRILINPSLDKKSKSSGKAAPRDVSEAISFSRYFRCRECNAGGPWELTDMAIARLADWLDMWLEGYEDVPIADVVQCTFDFEPFRYATEGEEHLKSLIAKDPQDSFLYDRLGNLLANTGRPDLAKEHYLKAIELDDDRVESHLSLGMILSDEDDIEAAAGHFHKFMDNVRRRKDIPLDDRIDTLKFAVDEMLDIHKTSGGKIPVLSGKIPEELKPFFKESEALVIRECVMSKPTDWTDFMACFLDEKPHKVKRHLRRIERELERELAMEEENERKNVIYLPQRVPDDDPYDYYDDRRASLPGTLAGAPALKAAPRVGRNEPCPCGSGIKYKKCCGKDRQH